MKGEVKREARGKFRVALGGTTCRSASQRAQTPRSSLRLMHPGWKKACGGQATRHGTLQQRRETNRKQRTYRLRTVGVGGICRGVSVSVKKKASGWVWEEMAAFLEEAAGIISPWKERRVWRTYPL